MLADRQVEVVVSHRLWRSLSRQARELGVSMELLAAGIVCDTIQPAALDRPARPRRQRPRTESHRPVRVVRH
ncbi:hypothetical protein OJF2_60840 [Aquisphaera giovannonii]|uniref:Uncharacterized protein n=1 Tax=Aquisphaera giovannonii TaxID=406548 RepID=A0A5B9WAB9_9BACT|nr:hypothetical protein [Aquisphaera giovannonii]QEH37493.1 hypothetical protein OJF2_60840 [Aquisphaera giovannonii]